MMEKVPKVSLALWFFVLNFSGGVWTYNSALAWIILSFTFCFVIEFILKTPCCLNTCSFSFSDFCCSCYSGFVACLVFFMITYWIDSSGVPYSSVAGVFQKNQNSKWPSIITALTAFIVFVCIVVETKLKKEKQNKNCD